MKRIRPINKFILIFILITSLILCISFSFTRSYRSIEKISSDISIYNDTILKIKDDFNKYLLYDSNIEYDKKKHLENTKK